MRYARPNALLLLATVVLGGLIALSCAPTEPRTGHPMFGSPHGEPIALHPTAPHAYVTNTAADTLDVIHTGERKVVARIAVGIDPVSVAVRPDGLEVWVSNHISDSVSVVDSDPASPTFHQVIATVQSLQNGVTAFDEPVGIAFADDSKAYVALSSRNQVAVVDVASYGVTQWISVEGQEPRALRVHDGRLFVIPFESGNQTQLSGCITGVASPRAPWCTFDIVEFALLNNILTLTQTPIPGADAQAVDLIRNVDFPDRDLFVIDTASDQVVEEVWTVGTLLYGMTIDSRGRVFVAQTEARNDANGLVGTQAHDLIDLDNRAFLNQIGVVDCSGASCATPSVIDLEPLPPLHPTAGTQLATPFGIAISDDDRTLVATAASSSRLFTVDTASGQVLGRVDVGDIPRGVALQSDSSGAPWQAWVFNAVGNSVSIVDVSDPAAPEVERTIALRDPTHPDVKLGRVAFNDADGSTTGTYSCGSCHPDGHTDQLLWVLGARCDIAGCNQVQPRSTMPIRGLRDTLPLHWDGAVGDPFGGINTENLTSNLPPSCGPDEHSCFRELVDGAQSGTMCDQAGCPVNEDGLPGAFGETERDAMAVFLRSVPYPPARSRPIDDDLSPLARDGFDKFLSNDGRPVCSRCHRLPFWVRTNTPGSGMDAPTFRGETDRFLTTPNGRPLLLDLLILSSLAGSEAPWTQGLVPTEFMIWAAGFGSEAMPAINRVSSGHGPHELWQMFQEGSTGFSGALGRQLTLNAQTTQPGSVLDVDGMLDVLERSDAMGVTQLDVTGTRVGGDGPDVNGTPVRYEFRPNGWSGARYWEVPFVDGAGYSRQDLIDAAAAGGLVATATARIGPNVDVDHPQPALWTTMIAGQGRHRLPHLPADNPMNFQARHLVAGTYVLIDGERVDARIECAAGSSFDLSSCPGEFVQIQLDVIPSVGQHLIQVANPAGLMSNEVLIFSD